MTDNDLWGTTVLLVEPNPEERDTLRHLLVRRGLTVFEASTHREAVEVLADSRLSTQILIIELMLPDVAGWHLARIVRAVEPGLPMIFMSSAAKPADESLNELVGASCGYLQKPISETALVEELRARIGSNGPTAN